MADLSGGGRYCVKDRGRQLPLSTMLTFVIPTRKRHRELAACLRSICEQIEDDTKIVVLINHDEADTVRVVTRCKEKWPCISFKGFDGEPDYAVKFKEMFRVAKDSDWVWTFGDDEFLQPGALKFMLAHLKKAAPELSFIHISEKNRSTSSGNIYSGRLVDLCCTFGWLEITGFISGNLIRGPLLAKCAEIANWDAYAKTAYVQSCALLEVLRREQAQFIDLPLFDSQPVHDEEAEKVKQKQWGEANTVVRYLYLADAIQLMYDQGILKKKVPAKFFRYHHAHLWNRHITCALLVWLQDRKIWFDEWTLYVNKMAQFVLEDNIREEIITQVQATQRLIIMQSALRENVRIIEDDLIAILEKQTVADYQFTMADSKTPENNAKISYMFKAA